MASLYETRAQEAVGILRRLNTLINTDDAHYALKTSAMLEESGQLRKALTAYFEQADELISERAGLLRLSHNLNRMKKDEAYRITNAFLYANENRSSKRCQMLFVIARLQIFSQISQMLIVQLQNKLRGICGRITGNLGNKLSYDCIKQLLEMGKEINEIKGYGRECNLTLDDFNRYLRLLMVLSGDKGLKAAECIRADIYPFQMNSAIRELLLSRTESCEAASILLRSYFETKIRRLLFEKQRQFFPTSNLNIKEILTACRKNDLHFSYQNEILLRLNESLNLIVHYGFKLNTALVWYIYQRISRLYVIAGKKCSGMDPDTELEITIFKVLKDLEVKKLVCNRASSPKNNRPGISVLWRY